jgi:cellulose synthase/poly-beta-1,6-N-acetylglucosamine synthase-like glycosyltransferase
MYTALIYIITITSILLIIQGTINIYLMLYSWLSPVHRQQNRAPKIFSPPFHKFTAIIPARHETQVIGDTVRAVSNINYPKDYTQIIIALRQDDLETIKATQKAIASIDHPHIHVIVFGSYPINKPHGLNVALAHAQNDILVIFDAEDEPHPEIYNLANTVILNDNVDVVQCGVQLMNFNSNWYSLFNVLEYYFWFKSTLHLFSNLQVIPLGGNTIFFKTKLIHQLQGWDQNCLTEDADIGIRLSSINARIRTVYEEKYATQEETPPTLHDFVLQRTRWSHGFLQILISGKWLQYNTLTKKLLSIYILSWPFAQIAIFLIWPISLAFGLLISLPDTIALISIAPAFLILIQICILAFGLNEFCRDYQKKCHLIHYLTLFVMFIPYLLLLTISSSRAITRFLTKKTKWEKTLHINAHRTSNTPAN